jgi:hypothetical protein
MVDLVRNLGKAGLPVIVTGDMNERSGYFCRLTASPDMHSAFGGSHSSGCRPADHRPSGGRGQSGLRAVTSQA